MRRAILNLLRCPRCRQGALVAEGAPAELLFGPLQCASCHATFPVAEGIADLTVEGAPLKGVQRSLEAPIVARSWERYVRPALTLALARRTVDPESEALLYRTMMGSLDAPVLDLVSGPALFARRLAKVPDSPPVVAMDVSRPMLEEGMAQAREANVKVDFVRAQPPHLPFLDGSLGAVLHTGALHLLEEPLPLLQEVFRALRPGGSYLATTYLPPSYGLGWAHRRLGLHPRAEGELRDALERAGLGGFERLRMPPFLLVKAVKPHPAARGAGSAV